MTKQIPSSWLETATYPVRADLTFSNTTTYGDGDISSAPYPGSWATQQAATVGSYANYTDTTMSAASSVYYADTGYLGINRAFLPFDTSSLPRNAVVSSSTLSAYVSGTTDAIPDSYATVNVYQGFEASPSQLMTSDFSKCGNAITNPTKGSTDLQLASTTASSTVTFALNSTALNWISTTTQYTELCLREGHDAADQALTQDPNSWLVDGLGIYTSKIASTTEEPTLSIVYSISNAAPATSTQLQAEDQTNPVNVIDTHPRFSAQYNDPDVADVALNYEIQIATSSSGFGSPFWDSGEQALSPGVNQGYQSQDISYTGSALALDSTTYYWRIKFWDTGGKVGPWSSGTDSFTMANDQTHIQSLHYAYDADGNITGILDDVNGGEQSTFTYDPLNRLTMASTTVTGGQTPYLRTYTYDPLGNLTSSDQGSYLYQGSQGTSYADPDAVTSIALNNATTTYTYDNNGNLLSNGTLTDVWNYLNQLTQAGKGGATSTYAYDYAGNRVKTVDSTGTNFYPNKYYSVFATTTPIYTKNIYANGLLVATISTTGATSAATSTPLLNATSTNISSTVASTTVAKSWTHTTSFGNNRLLVLTADILQHVAGTGSISSASYAGIPLIKAAATRASNMATELWYLIAPPSGVNTISVTTSGATDSLKFSLADYTGVNQFIPLDATSTASSTTGNPSSSVTTHLTGDLVTATLSRFSTTPATTNRSPLFNDTSSTTLGAASYQVAGTAGAISDTYTGTASQNWSMAMAAFRPATTSATVGTTTAIKYIHDDHLGGANVVTDSSGLIAETLQYYPYGSLRTDTLSNSYQGQRRKYLSQMFDTQTGLNYLGARFEQPGRGQFISEDPLAIQLGGSQIPAIYLQNPQFQNVYSYGGDNPVTQKDPSGKGDWLTPIFVGASLTYSVYSLGTDLGQYVESNFINSNNQEYSPVDKQNDQGQEFFDAITLTAGAELKGGTEILYDSLNDGLDLYGRIKGKSYTNNIINTGSFNFASAIQNVTNTGGYTTPTQSHTSNFNQPSIQMSYVTNQNAAKTTTNTSNNSPSVQSLEIQVLQLQIELLQLELKQLQSK